MELGTADPAGLLQRLRGLGAAPAGSACRDRPLGEQLGFGSIWMGEHVVAKWHPEGWPSTG